MLEKIRNQAMSETGDPLLLTPGPLTTSRSVKDAMVHGPGLARCGSFCRNQPAPFFRKAHGLDQWRRGFRHRCRCKARALSRWKPTLTTWLRGGGKVLVVINGAYGHRAKKSAASPGALLPSMRRRKTCRPISPR